MIYRLTKLLRDASPHMVSAGLVVGVLAACQPTVQVAAPEKPIVINLNVKIEHEVRVKLEKDVDELLTKNSELF